MASNDYRERLMVSDISGGKKVMLSSELDSPWKIFNLLLAVVLFFSGCALAYRTTVSYYDHLFQAISFLISAILVGSGFRFLHTAFASEYLLFTHESLTHISGGLRTRGVEYEIGAIKNFRYIQDELVEDRYHARKVAFDYNNETVVLGRQIFPWEYGKLLSILNEFAPPESEETNPFL